MDTRGNSGELSDKKCGGFYKPKYPTGTPKLQVTVDVDNTGLEGEYRTRSRDPKNPLSEGPSLKGSGDEKEGEGGRRCDSDKVTNSREVYPLYFLSHTFRLISKTDKKDLRHHFLPNVFFLFDNR